MRAAILGSVLMLAACSGQQGNASANGPASRDEGAAAATGAGLNLTDACAVVPGARMAEAISLPLRSAELRDVITDSGNGMSSSRCVYDFGDGLASVSVERFPDGADMASIFSGTRSLLSKNGTEAIEDVTGLGERAFWVPGNNNLYIMLGDNRQLVLATARLPASVDSKTALISVARDVLD